MVLTILRFFLIFLVPSVAFACGFFSQPFVFLPLKFICLKKQKRFRVCACVSAACGPCSRLCFYMPLFIFLGGRTISVDEQLRPRVWILLQNLPLTDSTVYIWGYLARRKRSRYNTIKNHNRAKKKKTRRMDDFDGPTNGPAQVRSAHCCPAPSVQLSACRHEAMQEWHGQRQQRLVVWSRC